MKEKNIAAYLLFLLVLVSSSHCTRPVVDRGYQPLTQVSMADANADITIETPANSIMLNGRAKPYYPNSQISTVSWKRISGSANCVIDHPQTLQTKVSNIEKGTYQFELYVRDNTGHFDIDTMKLKVEDPTGPNKQILFLNMKMIIQPGPLDDYRFLEIENFYEFVSPNNPFAIYIRMDSSLNWEPVVPFPQNNPFFSGYAYRVDNNNNKPSLVITEAPDGFISIKTPDIKIEY